MSDDIARHQRLIIVGSGPAGLTAAIYAGRANLAPVVFEGMQPGGQLTITTEVENYPGFPDGITGPELMDKFRAQAQRFGAKTVWAEVNSCDLSSRPFKLETDEGEFTCDSLIIATGASAKWLGLPSEQALMNHGVSACATCDGFLFRGKEVCVVGGGDTAMEEATYLTNHCTKVTVIHRRDELRASQIMADRALRNPKIEWLWSHEVVEVKGSPKEGVTAITVRNKKTGEVYDYRSDGLFLAIGHTPNSNPFRDWISHNGEGYLTLKESGNPESNIEGVFIAGDIHDTEWRQAVTAAGYGCAAAIAAERWLGAQE